jgi:hypothetical protein
MEAAVNITTAALVGGNMIHDVGYIEQGLLAHCMLVASDDIISRKAHPAASPSTTTRLR